MYIREIYGYYMLRYDVSIQQNHNTKNNIVNFRHFEIICIYLKINKHIEFKLVPDYKTHSYFFTSNFKMFELLIMFTALRYNTKPYVIEKAVRTIEESTMFSINSTFPHLQDRGFKYHLHFIMEVSSKSSLNWDLGSKFV